MKLSCMHLTFLFPMERLYKTLLQLACSSPNPMTMHAS